jgi:predicted DNA-binding protein
MSTPCIGCTSNWCSVHSRLKTPHQRAQCKTDSKLYAKWTAEALRLPEERKRRLNELQSRIKTRGGLTLRLLSWLCLLAAPTDKGVGTTILRLLPETTRKPWLRDQLQLILKSYDCTRQRVSVATLDRVYPNPNFIKSKNFHSSPGDSLNHYLVEFGMNIEKDCNCTTWVDIMNAWGVALCREKSDQVLMWLRHEAETRKLQFDSAVAKQLIEKSLREAEDLS